LPKKAELVPIGGDAVCADCSNWKLENVREAAVVAVAVDEAVVGRGSGVDELGKEVEAGSKLAKGFGELVDRDEENVKPEGTIFGGAPDVLEADVDGVSTLGFPNEVAEEDQLG
jgi:hypothetical protein